MKKLAFIFCLFLSVQAFAQSGDTTRKPASKPAFTLAYKTDPLIVLDGMVYKGALNSISPEDIHDINILKGTSATALYGQDAIMGAVVIKTKKYVNAIGEGIALHKDSSITLKLQQWGTAAYPAKPLIILDGVVYSGDIKSIDPNTIQSIDVYRGEKAKALYGEKAAAGAIVVKTKEHQKADTTDKIKE
ncbi:MAG: TonB-dependent receptor plug domain-containing protein [Sphingobacteriales bacterium]